MHVGVDIRRETYDKGCGAFMGSRSEHDDETIQFAHAVTAQRDGHERLEHDAAASDEKPTIIAASPSQSMLQVADPTDALSSPELAHPADDEPDTMMTLAPEPVSGSMPASRPRLPTPRMDLRMYTPASIGPTALTLAPPAVPRTPFPVTRFDGPETGSFQRTPPSQRESRLHPVAWIAVGVILGAGAMAAVLVLRDNKDAPTNATPASANTPIETDLDKVAPMPSAAAPHAPR